uniref:Uncharacterized protein n=1 Tax=Tanacetum cinerariifolium TaxID=118510 RepID=A0A6L2JYZ8_TANCI|nr:hypothetical protein [Tanacetum cinerariifolium]
MRIILNSVLNGSLVWPTIIEENGTNRTKKYEELLVVEKLQADCDLKATDIVLQGLLPNVYAIGNHHKVAKEIWDRVKLLIQGIKFDDVSNENAILMTNLSNNGLDVISEEIVNRLLDEVEVSLFETKFEKDIDDEGEEDKEGDDGSENEMIHHHFQQGYPPTDEMMMMMDDLEW